MSVKRTFLYDTWVPSTASTSGFWKYYSSTLGDIPSISDYVNLFDLYRIKAVKFTFVPKYDNFAGNDTTDTTAPGITNCWGVQPHVILDPHSTVTPTGTYTLATYADFSANGAVRQHVGNKTFSVYYRPKVLDTMAGLSAMPKSSPWIFTSQSGVAHRGFHVFMTDYGFSGTGFGNQGYNVFVTLYLQFKNAK